MDQTEMIARIAAGDPGAERALYDAHVERVYRLAFRMTGDGQMAEDLTQEAFLRIFDRLSGFRGQAALSTWIHKVAASVILNGLRKEKRHREHVMVGAEAVAVDPGMPPEDVELRLRLLRAIDQLSDRLRMVFVMHEVEGYKHQEIAEIFGLTVGTCRARLARAREQLRTALGAYTAAGAGDKGR